MTNQRSRLSPAPSRHDRRGRLAFRWLLPAAATQVALVLFTGFGVGLVLALGGTVSGVEVVLAALATGAALVVWTIRLHGSRWWIATAMIVGVTAAVLVPAVIFGGRVLDDTWDGQWYHQEALIQLAEGWNPYHGELGESEVADEGARLRINSYPKATWLWGAGLYSLTGRIEHAKSYSPLLMSAAALAVLACLLAATPIRGPTAAAISLVAAANPVAVTQVLNSYQDGALASLFVILCAGLVLWIRCGSRLGLGLATAGGVGVAAVKLTGGGYVAVIVGAALVWLWRTGNWRRERGALVIAVVSAAVGVHLLSGGTYLTNTAQHGHPLYPVLGPDRVTLVRAPEHNHLATGIASIFTRSRLTSTEGEAIGLLQSLNQVKWPFTSDREEWEAFYQPKVRTGGLGPLFGGVALLAAGLLLAASLRDRQSTWMALLASFPVVLSVVINPQFWMARYVPQMWLVPLVVTAVVLSRRPGRVEKTLASGLLLTAAVNSVFIASFHVSGVTSHSRELKDRLFELAMTGRPLEIDLGVFRSNRARLSELGITYQETGDFRYNLPTYLGYSPLTISRVEVEPIHTGGGLAWLEWEVSPGVDRYVVEVVAGPPKGPGGGPLTLARLATTETSAAVPLPAGPVRIVVGNCNALGCGIVDRTAPIAVGGRDRMDPVLGVPAGGEVLDQPEIVFAWSPAEDDSAGYRFTLEDLSTGEMIVDRDTDALWIGHRFSSDGPWRARVARADDGDGHGSEVRFQTRGVAAPRIVAPLTGSRVNAGTVEIAWSAVPGTTGYEYFVAITGHPTAVARGVTADLSVAVDLAAVDNRETVYSVIARACLDPSGCQAGSEIGWGPWSHDAGLGDVKVTVAP